MARALLNRLGRTTVSSSRSESGGTNPQLPCLCTRGKRDKRFPPTSSTSAKRLQADRREALKVQLGHEDPRSAAQKAICENGLDIASDLEKSRYMLWFWY